MKTRNSLIALFTMAVAGLTLPVAADIPVPAGSSIQAALDAAAANPGPDVVVVAAGTYDETLIISDADPVSLLGSGTVIIAGVDPDEATITIQGGHVTVAHLTVTAGDDGIQAVGCASLTLRHLTVTETPDEGVEIEDCAEVTVDNCQFLACGDDSLKVESLTDDPWGTLTVNNCSFIGSDGDGIKAENLVKVTINSSISIDNDDGYDLDGVTSMILRNVVANGNEDEGLEVDGGGSVEVVEGNFHENEGEGIDIDDAPVITLTAVHCARNEGSGLQVTAEEVDVESVSIVNGRFVANEGNGVEMYEDEAAVLNVQMIAVSSIDNDLRGLELEISGKVSRYQVTSKGNGLPDLVP